MSDILTAQSFNFVQKNLWFGSKTGKHFILSKWEISRKTSSYIFNILQSNEIWVKMGAKATINELNNDYRICCWINVLDVHITRTLRENARYLQTKQNAFSYLFNSLTRIKHKNKKYVNLNVLCKCLHKI